MLNELSQIFLTFLYKNMTVSVVIIAVLLARLLLRKMPKKYSYILWSRAAIPASSLPFCFAALPNVHPLWEPCLPAAAKQICKAQRMR